MQAIRLRPAEGCPFESCWPQKLKVDNFMQYGAELQWLSAFPLEAEVLYPPLTYLQPTGRTQLVELRGFRFTAVEVEPHLA